MRRLTKMALTLMLAVALSLTALTALSEAMPPDFEPADRPETYYANREKVKVYTEPNTNAEVMEEIRGGKSVALEGSADHGRWLYINFENSAGGTWKGWVESEFMTDTLPQSFCQHRYGDWTVDTQPSCTSAGYRYRFCEICGIRDEEDIPRLKHDFGSWKVTKEATCAKEGERTRTCKNCGYEEKESYLEDHTPTAWKMTKEPTCTQTGERVRSCKVCGKEQKQELDKLPHDYAWKVTVEATDHSSGKRAKVCRVCGHEGGEESYDPEGTLRRKARGEDVYAVQQLLVDQGYLNVGGADGIFGGGTEKAVMQFQKDQGLTADGIVWPQTRKLLNHDFGPWQTIKPMKRNEPGERVRVCVDCGFEQHETIEAGTVFERGRRGEDVRALQQIIKQVGYDAGSFDGIYGKKLDAALAGFAADRGMVVEAGKVRPADVDAVVSAWIEALPEAEWKGEGSVDSPVNLALTVNETEPADDSGIATYSWSLTNLGDEKVMFNALLLSFGSDDFKSDDLVMVLDGIELKAGAKNAASGSFRASSDWGEGELHFAAMAVSEADGAKWLSNTVSFENANAPAQKTVAPQRPEIDVNALPDGTYPVAFDRGDVLSGASGIYMNAVHIFAQDWYDLVDISTLAVGDTLVVAGEEIPVETVEMTDYGIVINDFEDRDPIVLMAKEDANGYTISGLDDMPTYTELGVATLTLDPAATYIDSSDIDGEPVTAAYDGIVAAMQASENAYFVQYNTLVRVENGRVVEINRVYVP